MNVQSTETRVIDAAQGRYEQMLASSATAAICAGTDNLIVSWNVAAEQLFGHRAAQVIGKSLSLIIPERYREAHVAGFARAVRAGHARLAGRSVDILALHADGREIPVDLSLSMWFEAGRPMFGALLRDIANRHLARQQLEYLAHCDVLTSLPNRNALNACLETSIAAKPCTLLMLDLDGFKHVNDTLGHSVGDKLLAAVAARLSAAVGDDGFLARLGGDEFAILVSDCVDRAVIERLAARIHDSLAPHFLLADQMIYVGTSIGIAMSPSDARDVDQLISRADLALYSAKSAGGGSRAFFTRAMQDSSEQRHRLSSELRQALASREFEVYYQPQVALPGTHLSGVEALLRWRHPQRGLLAPQAFMGLLEESAIAEDVGHWVLDQACAAAAAWRKSGLGAVRVGVNLFAAQLHSDRLCEVVASTLARYGLPHEQLELEITENTVLRRNLTSTKSLRKLKALGVSIAFDDFGTGFASLSLLRKFPLSRLKIDRSFVSRMHRLPRDAVIVDAVVKMAKSLGLKVTAEGVETIEQQVALVRCGCDEAQGHLYGRAMPARAIEALFCAGSTAVLSLELSGTNPSQTGAMDLARRRDYHRRQESIFC